MSSNALRSQVLKCFREIHKTRKYIFKGDEKNLTLVRERINEEFAKHKHVKSEAAIEELVKAGHEAAQLVRTQLMRYELTPQGTQKVSIREELLVEHGPYQRIPDGEYMKHKRTRKCGGATD